MATWPSSLPAPRYGLKEEIFKPQVRTPFEGGYVQSRPAATRSVRRWPNLVYVLTSAQLATLQTFFDTYQGSNFDWIHPDTGITYDCRFSEDSIIAEVLDKEANGFYWRVPCPIEEV